MGNSGTTEQQPVVEPIQPQEDSANSTNLSAVILGATGATGVHLVQQLLFSNRWSKITIIHRREIDLKQIAQSTQVSFTEEQQSKLSQHVVDMSKLVEDENVEKFVGHDTIFCALGSTRAKAKTADNFRKIDLDMVRDAAIAGKKAGVKHFSLISSKGANANTWANDWKVSHFLLYFQVKGLAENSVMEQLYERTSIWRPSFLERMLIPGKNKYPSFVDTTYVSDLASVMILDAEIPQVPPISQKIIEKTDAAIDADANAAVNDADANAAVDDDANAVVDDDANAAVDDADANAVEEQKQEEDESSMITISKPVIFEISMITALIPFARKNREKFNPIEEKNDKSENIDENMNVNANVEEENIADDNAQNLNVVENHVDNENAQSNTMENNVEEYADGVNVEKNAAVDNVEENAVAVNVEENAVAVNVEENAVAVNVEENAVAVNVEENAAAVNVEENAAAVNVEENVAVDIEEYGDGVNIEENVAVDNVEENVDVETEENDENANVESYVDVVEENEDQDENVESYVVVEENENDENNDEDNINEQSNADVEVVEENKIVVS